MGELAGPDEQHLVLVDNGRSKLLGTEFAEALECIRCGACLAACPVYERAGGHTYQSVYPGPIGKVVTPLYGFSPIVEQLPHASPLCGACKDACPVKIDIPRMLIRLRRDYKFHGSLGRMESTGVRLASQVLASPSLYKLAAKTARIGLALMAKKSWVVNGPVQLAEWTLNHDLPVPDTKPFRRRWRDRKKRRI